MSERNREVQAWYEEQTATYLSPLIERYVFPGAELSLLLGRALHAADIPKPESEGQLAIQGSRTITVLIAPMDDHPVAALRIKLPAMPEDADVKFADCFAKVFSQDLRWAAKIGPDGRGPRWSSLQRTQFPRAIACFLHQKDEVIEKWLRAAENSMHLTYEGQSARPCIVFYRKQQWAEKRLPENFYRFPEPIPVSALFDEKWIRAVVEGRRVALVGDLESTKLTGFMSPANLEASDEQQVAYYAPHESLRLLQGALGKTGIAMVVSTHGELFVLKGTDVVFRKAQGRWRYINYAGIHRRLSRFLDRNVVVPLLRAAIDLSFEHKGALFCVHTSEGRLRQMVEDHKAPGRINRILRKTLSGLQIGDQRHRQLITAAAVTDGAVVLGPDGKVLDVACMIGSCKEGIEALGKKRPALPGARSQAAWRASIYGVSLKISTDGPITGYAGGDQVFYIG